MHLLPGGRERIVLTGSAALREMYTLSPFVWRERPGFRILVRAVNDDRDPAKKVARVYGGVSVDGIHFSMLDRPVIAPGPEAFDRDGCEDPTVVVDAGEYTVFYSGWNQDRKIGTFLSAAGSHIESLRKCGPVPGILPSSYPNAKEATVARASDGTWCLFFEFAQDGRSKIGAARARHLRGPWVEAPPPLLARTASWDSWHLSPGPALEVGGHRLLFYNGSNEQAHWRIGWALFDAQYRHVLARSAEPVVTPDHLARGFTDIAFAASAVAAGRDVGLYYSIADREMIRAIFTVK